MNLSHFARVALGHFPTPLERLALFEPSIGGLRPGQRVLIKRDDCTGLAFGGNKVRKLEFALGQAAAQGVDTIVTCGAFQSNHVRQTAAAAVKLGLAFHGVVSCPVADPAPEMLSSGNRLLDVLLGATLHVAADDGAATTALADELLQQLRAEGRRPLLVPVGASNGVGALGYVLCAQELLQQCADADVHPTHVVLATGSGGTHAGLLQGLRLFGSGAKVIGVSVSEPSGVKRAKVRRVLDELSEVLERSAPVVREEEIVVYDGYVGAGYAMTTPAANDAIRRVARTEGVLLDPVYTGKAMAGLIDLIAAGEFADARDIIFLHTGGTPALFAYPGVSG